MHLIVVIIQDGNSEYIEEQVFLERKKLRFVTDLDLN